MMVKDLAKSNVHPQRIPIFIDKWAIVSANSKAFSIDGTFSEVRWQHAVTVANFTIIYSNQHTQQLMQVKLTYDDYHFYVGIKGEQLGSNDICADVFTIVLRPPGEKHFYSLTVPIRGRTKVISVMGPHMIPLGEKDFVGKVVRDHGTWTAEVAIPLHTLGVQRLLPGQEWGLNVLRHRFYSEPTISWIPLKTSYFHEVTKGAELQSIVFYTNTEWEGRFGAIYIEHLPVHEGIPAEGWIPEEVDLLYTGFTNKQLMLSLGEQFSEKNLRTDDIQLEWRTPSGMIYSLETERVEGMDEKVHIRFTHPPLIELGGYRLQIRLHRDGEPKAKICWIYFDREDVIEAGERTVNPQSRIVLPTTRASLQPVSSHIQKLLDMIPAQSGMAWLGLPEHPDFKPYQLFQWDPESPDQLTSEHSEFTFPNDVYPETQVIHAINGKGEQVEYPYYEDKQGKRYFFTAHIWYQKRQYVTKLAEQLVISDPSGAARILYKFAQVYEGYVPVYDHVWNNKPFHYHAGPPHPYYGGMWDWWFFMDLTILSRLARTYGRIKGTELLELLSTEVGEDARSKIVNGMLLPSVEFIRTYAERDTNMDFHIWKGYIELGQAIDRPELVHEGIERLHRSAVTQYLFDGFYKEITLSYHSQSVNGTSSVVDLLDGWTDPEDFLSQRTGERLVNLKMREQFPILQRSKNVMKSMTYPDGKYVPLQDTWAWQSSPDDPLLDTILLPAAGVARFTKGQRTQSSQLYMTFTSKFGHNHYDPLNLLLYSQGQELLPDLGYTYTRYRHWTNSTMSHNTVVVNAADMDLNKKSQLGGNIELFAPVDGIVQVMEASQTNAYRDVSEYRRQSWFIAFPDDPTEGYVLDLFKVSGGRRHEYTLNGTANVDACFTTELKLSPYGPYLLPQGVDVQLPQESRDKGSAEHEYYGYIYVREVQQAKLIGDHFSVILETNDEGNPRARMKITGLLQDDGNELFLGRSPSIRQTRLQKIDTNDRADDFTMPKMVWRREGQHLNSHFVTLLEPYAADAASRIDRIESMEMEQAHPGDKAIRIIHGVTEDIIISAARSSSDIVVYSVDAGPIRLKGRLGFIRIQAGNVVKMVMIDGTSLSCTDVLITGSGSITGIIEQVYREAEGHPYNAFVTSAVVPEEAIDQYMIVTHPDGKTHGYKVTNVRRKAGKHIIVIEGDPGFTIHLDGSSTMKYFPSIHWQGEHSFQVNNVVTWES